MQLPERIALKDDTAIANGLQVQQTKENHDAFFPMLRHPR
jgi:hypothetical protein